MWLFRCVLPSYSAEILKLFLPSTFRLVVQDIRQISIRLYEDVDFKTLFYLYTKSHATVPHKYRRSQSKFIFNKSLAKNDPHYGKSTVVFCFVFMFVFFFSSFFFFFFSFLFFTVKVDATNSFPSNTTEVQPIYLNMGHIMRQPVFVISAPLSFSAWIAMRFYSLKLYISIVCLQPHLISSQSLTLEVVEAPQMTLQQYLSILPCLPLPSGNLQTPFPSIL